MNHFFTAVLLAVFSLSATAQKQLSYPTSTKESLFEVFPYNDGSFSVYSAFLKTNGHATMEGTFRTYNKEGVLVLEKPLFNGLQFRLGVPDRPKVKGFRIMAFPRYVYNPEAKQTLALGFSTKGLHCRILNDKGEFDEILITDNELNSNVSNVVAATLDEDGNVNVVLHSPKMIHSHALWVHIDIHTKTHLIKSLDDYIDKASTGTLKYLMNNSSGLFLLSDGTKLDDHVAVLLRIDETGTTTAKQVTLRHGHVAYNTIEELKGIGEEEGVYFSMRPRGSIAYHIYRITEELGMEEVMLWRVPDALYDLQIQQFGKMIDEYVDPSAKIPDLSIYSVKGRDYLLYSYRGGDLTSFPVDLEEGTVGDFDRETYIPNIRIARPAINCIPFMQQKELVMSLLKNAQGWVSYRTIYNGDGTYGFILIAGDRAGMFKYTNIQITKY